MDATCLRTGKVLGLAATVLAACGLSQPAPARPALVGDASRPECRIALKMAIAAFDSESPTLYWPIAAPDGKDAVVVLSRNVLDISGGNALMADPGIFEQVEAGESPLGRAVLYWQRRARNGSRLAVADVPFNWQGDWYYVFDVEDGTAPLDVLRDIAGPRTLHPLLGDNRWHPPVILEAPDTGELWILDQGGFGSGLVPWKVYAAKNGQVASPCRIDFMTVGFDGLESLPAAVRRFAGYADAALGPGAGEGTLHPTATIRGAAQVSWAILAERPWALTSQPYNSRDEVEAGLAAWAKGVPARERLHRNLRASYGPARDALAGYLVGTFAIGRTAAERFSGYAMDLMLRSYFVFHSDSGGQAKSAAAPWPPEIR